MKIKFLKFIKIDLNKQYREKQRKFIESIKIIIFCFFFIIIINGIKSEKNLEYSVK